jgi:hypothetical protein
MRLASKWLPTDGKLDLPLLDAGRRPRSGARLLVRLIRRHAPGFLLVLFVLPVLALVLLDAALPAARKPLDDWADGHKVAADLLAHALVAAAVAAVAVYWVLGSRRQKALKSYRSKASEKPAEFVEWSRGETPIVRLGTCQRLADAIRRSGEKPAVAVIQGRPGTGRTSCVVGLVRELADHKMIPIPVLAKRDGPFELEELAREKFCRYVDRVLSSDQQADAIWHRARSARDIVILVDGLDDEIIEKLSSDNGKLFRKTIGELLDSEIAVVLATTRELPLGNDITPVREDLHPFNREEATSYVQSELDGSEAQHDALAALEKLPEPIDGFLVAPFYVDLIVRLQKARISLKRLPRQTDQWRAEVLRRYLHGIDMGRIEISGPDTGDLRRRAQAAKEAAEQVAGKLTIDEADRISVPRSKLDIDDLALRDAEDLNLLWKGDESVGFASEDLGAYLRAVRREDPTQLLDDTRVVAESDRLRERRDRFVRAALIFWHLRHEEARVATFEKFLNELENRRWTRPLVAFAAVRIACACELDEFTEPVAKAARRCVWSLNTKEKRAAKSWQAYELLGLVRALAAWPCRDAHLLLWELATNQNLEIEWWAAKALATAKAQSKSKDHPAQTLKLEIGKALSAAEQDPRPTDINKPDDDTGQKIASLAWILPALRAQGSLEDEFSRLRDLCLADWMSPLRGEMQLAQGLKLAILDGSMVPENVKLVRELLVERNGGLRFWHARLVLVHALLAHAWKHGGDEVERVRSEFADVFSRESHPLVLEAIALARRGLHDLEQMPTVMTKYMWSHEREVVRFVELGRDRLAQLAADVVLLSNMTYRLREQNHDEATRAAVYHGLPPCIRKSSSRLRIDIDCECKCDCGLGLCGGEQENALLNSRAPFSASFCRDQSRVIGLKGAPGWTARLAAGRNTHLKKFWDRQATLVQSGSRRSRSAPLPPAQRRATARERDYA